MASISPHTATPSTKPPPGLPLFKQIGFKQVGPKGGDLTGRGEQAPQDEPQALEEEAPGILCRQCRHIITRPDEETTIQGSHQHTFANPNGIVFQIVCFQAAEGCGYAGPPTDEFSWFPGYLWRVAVCSRCLLHMGWLYLGADGRNFHGLILDHLIFPE